MASIRKLKSGKYICEVRISGFPATSKTFLTKLEAQAWGVKQEQSFGKHSQLFAQKTLHDAYERYKLEVTPKKKGVRWETIRLTKLQRDTVAFMPLNAITSEHMQKWIDDRCAEVSPATVRRELVLISSVFNVARKRWKWCSHNPVSDTEKPRAPEGRDRLLTDSERERILLALDYMEGEPIRTQRQIIAVAMLLAIETAMRQGELWSLHWCDVHIDKCFVRLHDTKNGTRRDVPLSKRAIELLAMLRPLDKERVLPCNQASAGTIFRRAVQIAGVHDFCFHDLRHLSITLLADKLHMLELARMVGHKDPRMLTRYYNASASSLAAKLG